VRVRFAVDQQEGGFVKVPLDDDSLNEWSVGDELMLTFDERHLRIFA
jgi:putative spermidine/putrescine transport system ATP-binding protein